MKRLSGVILLLVISLTAFSQGVDRPTQPDLKGDLLLDFGLNLWSESPDNLPLRVIGSNSIGIYYNRRIRMSDRLSFYPAIGFGFDKYAFDNNYTWRTDDAGALSLDTLNGVSLDKNKLIVSYLEVPLEIRIHPLKTVKGEGWFIGLGAIGGVRIGAHTKIRYDAEDGANRKEKIYDSFKLSDFKYGYQVRFGFRSIHVYYKGYLSDLFRSSPDESGVIPQTSTIGISFSGF